jgi:hypothetical protein
MTRTEQTGTRNLDFSGWIRRRLTSARGFTVFDLDFIFRDYERKRLQLVEVKTHGSDLSTMQRIALGEVATILRTGIEHGAPAPGWMWCGFHTVRLENTAPDNGRILWDGVPISEAELIERLEMRKL